MCAWTHVYECELDLEGFIEGLFLVLRTREMKVFLCRGPLRRGGPRAQTRVSETTRVSNKGSDPRTEQRKHGK